MKHTALTTAQEAQARRNTTRRQPRTLSPEALAAKARLAETTKRLREQGGMPASVLRQ